MKRPKSNYCDTRVETETYMLGGFPGHEYYHPSTRYTCSKCGKTLDFWGQREVLKFYYDKAQKKGQK